MYYVITILGHSNKRQYSVPMYCSKHVSICVVSVHSKCLFGRLYSEFGRFRTINLFKVFQ